MTNEIIDKFLDKQISYIEKISEKKTEINEIYQEILRAREENRKIFIMGNGGSASTASHFTSDLLKTSILKNKKRFKAICLTDNIPVISAWSNDLAYEHIFEEQLRNFLEKDDIVLTISGSGNSKNVIKATEFANEKNAITISFTGRDGGILKNISKLNLNIQEEDMLSIETGHLLICHLLTTMFRADGEPMFSY